MSDAIHPLESDRRRTLASLAAALGIHAAVLVVVALAVTLGGPSPELMTPIDVQIDSGRASAGQGISEGSAPGPAPSAAHAPAAALPGQGSAAGEGFAIPTVRRPAPDSAPSAGGGASFREAGGKIGAGGALPAVQNQLPQPAVAAGPQARSSGEGTTAGSAAADAQRSGEGVLVGPDNGAPGPLDLRKLDQAIAGRGAGAPGAAGASSGSATGGTGAGPAGGKAGQGGTATSQGRAGGGGGGAGGAGDYRVVWDQPDAGKERVLLSRPDPKLPSWVSKQGLTLSVTASFVLMSDGVVSVVSMARSSGYADVDSAFIDAIRRWRFTAAKGAGPVSGLIPYVIRSK
jgi:TonB family protein